MRKRLQMDYDLRALLTISMACGAMCAHLWPVYISMHLWCYLSVEVCVYVRAFIYTNILGGAISALSIICQVKIS